MEAEIVLRALEEALWRWSAAAEGGEGALGVEREAAGVAVLRAACRRSRSDFLRAGPLLEGLDVELLETPAAWLPRARRPWQQPS